MIKRTLYFGTPAYLSLKLDQLVFTPAGKDAISREDIRTVPVEDIGFVVLDNRQITVTQGLLERLLDNNCALVTCDAKHLPVGLMLPLAGNTIQNERFRSQLDASLPLKKQLWQQTIQAKIRNQAAALYGFTGVVHNNMLVWADAVRSGDADNMEARAAVYYWKTAFPECPDFTRDQDEEDANVLLNYGYAILRAIVARALVCSGLLPTLGIHHHNRYNAYCLADDIMEPYRPYVDKVVKEKCLAKGEIRLTREVKAALLNIAVEEVVIDGKRSPLMNAVSSTTASVAKCFSGECKKILYPVM